MTERTSSRPLVLAGIGALCVLAVVAAMVGTVLAAGDISPARPDRVEDDPATYRAAEPVTTSFGSVTVGAASRTKGLTAQDLAGQSHGIGNLVKRKDVAVSVEVTVTNRRAVPVPFSPAAFTLALHKDGVPVRRVRVGYSSVKAAELVAGASMNARLSFVAPRDQSHVSLEFTDAEAGVRHTIDLERTTGRASRGEVADAHSGHQAK
jgi:Domain of unknown function (DUF4352)